MIQGSTEWFEARRGFLGASGINDALATTKTGGEAATRRNLRAKLIAERLTGVCEDSYTSAAMQWGIDHEPIARAMYETHLNCDVDQVGFILHPELKMTGASPDGLVGDKGLVEIKCPNTATHIDYLLGGVAPAQYRNQMLWQMECTGRDWCDFVSYDPRMPEDMQLLCVRFHRDDEELNKIRSGVVKFLDEVNEVISKLQNIRASNNRFTFA
jgi:putative phage-type endonuclease